MDRIELADIADQILDAHRSNLLIDSFVRIKIEVTEGNFTSQCIPDASPMSWVIQLNPERHHDFFDIQYSILESLLTILFDDLRFANNKEDLAEFQRRIVARLTTAFCDIFLGDEEYDDDEDIDEED